MIIWVKRYSTRDVALAFETLPKINSFRSLPMNWFEMRSSEEISIPWDSNFKFLFSYISRRLIIWKQILNCIIRHVTFKQQTTELFVLKTVKHRLSVCQGPASDHFSSSLSSLDRQLKHHADSFFCPCFSNEMKWNIKAIYEKYKLQGAGDWTYNERSSTHFKTI